MEGDGKLERRLHSEWMWRHKGNECAKHVKLSHDQQGGLNWHPCIIAVWLEQGCLQQMVLVITEADTKDVLERWTFDIDTNKDVLAGKGWVPEVHHAVIAPSASEQPAVKLRICCSQVFTLPTKRPALTHCAQAPARQAREGDPAGDPGHHAPGRYMGQDTPVLCGTGLL